MDLQAYNAVRREPGGAGVGMRRRAWLRLSGQDRQSFLNGQITNEVVFLQPGHGLHACLLNNTGHMLANLYVHARHDDLLIEVTPSRATLVQQTLTRYIVRERVEIDDISADWATLTVQGEGARSILASVTGHDLPDNTNFPLSNAPLDIGGDVTGLLIEHTHTASRGGLDIVVPVDAAPEMLGRLLAASGAAALDRDTAHVLRVEAGLPIWGAELDESVIPLEANLSSAISQRKGCYMGQEVIARIVSRGHTNRTLVGLRLSGAAEPGVRLQADEGPRRNQNPGKITSFALSPDAGPIALGYVRAEYAHLGVKLHTEDGSTEAAVAALPFVA